MDLVNLPLVSAGASHLGGIREHPGSGAGSRSDSSPACLVQVSAESWGVQEVGLETLDSKIKQKPDGVDSTT